MTRRNSAVCTCLAYAWPHRAGAGKCDSIPLDDETASFCGLCGRECDALIIDAFAPKRRVVSSCCAADVFTDAELLYPLEEK